MHFCQDELNAIFMGIPFVGAIYMWLKSKFHHMAHHPECELKQLGENSPSNPEETEV